MGLPFYRAKKGPHRLQKRVWLIRVHPVRRFLNGYGPASREQLDHSVMVIVTNIS